MFLLSYLTLMVYLFINLYRAHWMASTRLVEAMNFTQLPSGMLDEKDW